MQRRSLIGNAMKASLECEGTVVAKVDELDTPPVTEPVEPVAKPVDGFVGPGVSEGEADPIELFDDVEISAESAALFKLYGSLEAIAGQLETAVTNGGMRHDTLPFYNIAIESAYAQTGITDLPTISVEAYGNTMPRLQTTKASLEDIKDTVKKVGQAIWNAIVKAAQYVMAYVNRLSNGARTLEQRAHVLRDRVRADKSDRTSKTTIKLGKTASRLMIGEKVIPVGTALPHMHEGFSMVTGEILVKAEKVVAGALGELSQIIDANRHNAGATAGKMASKLKELVGQFDNYFPQGFDSTTEEGKQVAYSKVMPGNKRIKIVQTKVQEKAPNAGDPLTNRLERASVGTAAHYQVSIVDAANAPTVDESHEAPTLQYGDIEAVAETASKIARDFADFDTNVSKLNRYFGASSFAAKTWSHNNYIDGPVLRQGLDAVGRIQKYATAPGLAMGKHMLDTLQAAVIYGEQSFGAHA